MLIREALPGIFHKAYAVLDPKTDMLAAMSLLRFHEIDVLPLTFDPAKRNREGQKAVFGFSSLARLLTMKPEQFGKFLKQPCEAASEPLVSVRADQGLPALLDTFARTRFGFARVEDGYDVGGLVGLYDVLGLYDTGAIASDLAVRDVGSRVLAMPDYATLNEALAAMFEKRYRRVFLSGKKTFVSDRAIIGHIFSPAVLKTIVQDSKDVLEQPISGVIGMNAREVSPRTSLREASRILAEEKAGQCLTFGETVVTPWDVVMKPWTAKALNLKA